MLRVAARALAWSGAVGILVVACGDDSESNTTTSTSSGQGGSGANGGSGATGGGGAGGAEPACGDGTVQPDEGCDDGNTRPGDGCSAGCTLEPVPEACPGLAVPLTEEGLTIVGSTIGLADDAQGERCGGYGAPDAVYAVTPAVTGTLNATLYGSFNKILIARDACTSGDADAELGCTRGYGAQTATVWAIAGQTYHFIVDGDEDGASGNFTLALDLFACGDGVVQGLEQCDDQNDDADDGCAGCVSCDGPGEFWDPTGGHCYRLMTDVDFWEGARRECREWGGDLVGLSSADELALVAENAGAHDVWTSGVDRHEDAQDCTFYWGNGEPWRPSFTAPEPDNLTLESCVELVGGTQGFADENCGNNRAAVCERAPHGACGDRIIQANEECDDGNATEGDGCFGCEVICPPGEIKEPRSLHCYRIVTVGPSQKSWDDAEFDCDVNGAKLAAIDTPGEIAFLGPHLTGSVWIGGRVDAGAFAWMSGEPWCFTAWAGGQPSTNPDDGCLAIGEDGKWTAAACTGEKGYVCERPPFE